MRTPRGRRVDAQGGRTVHASWRSIIATVLLGAALAVPAQEIPDDPEERARREQEIALSLERLRQDVAELKAALDEGRRAESAAVAAVAEAERAVSDHGRALAAIDAQGVELSAELTRIASRRLEVENELAGQREGLAALLRLDYARSRQAPVKLLLDPDRVPSLARNLGYSRMLQRGRMEAIRSHADALDELVMLAEAQTTALAAVDDQQTRARAQAQVLANAVADRERALAALRADLAGRQERLGALTHDEQALQRLLEQLRDIFADLPDTLDGAEPFRSLRGRLPWPVAGSVSTGGNGGLRIEAEAGADISAIAHGRVAFADWLRGYGLLLILDHGDGYMSLYGHNETLLRQEGAWVRAGERIAQVGRSGGEARPSLYFELREGGRSIDPRPWLRRR